jgi:uncharacterized Tic20 family protein
MNKTKKESDNTNISILAHVIGPFTYALGTVLVYLAYKDVKDKVLKSNIVNALNFQLTCTGIQILLAIIAGYEMNKLYSVAKVGGDFLAFPIYTAIALIFFIQLVNTIASIIGAFSARKHKIFNYRVAIKFIK